MTALVIRQDIDGVAVLTLNRPDKLNALNVALFQELYDHAKDIENTRDDRLRRDQGAGRCFSAGHDLGDIAAGEKLPRPNFQAKVIEALTICPNR